MKCIGKYSKLISVLLLTVVMATGCGITDLLGTKNVVAEYEAENYNKDLYTGKLFASDLCVASGDISLSGISSDETNTLHSAALFDVDRKKVDFSYQMFDKIYPASTTKIMTALLALENSNLDDQVTFTEECLADQTSDSGNIGMQVGEVLTMRQCLLALMIRSANDVATQIAVQIAGSVSAFADMMNQEALAMGASRSHFVNPNGLPDENHYTSVYDLYLIFQNAVQDQTFLDIISTMSYDVVYTDVNGAGVEKTWENTNQYLTGKEKAPEGITVVGGKTGTTGAAGYCLVLYSYNASGQPIVSIVLKADGKSNLYLLMNEMLSGFAN